MFHVPPALKHRNFALIWGGLLVSMIGTQMQQWALFWHISKLSDDPIAVSVVGGVRFVAVLSFSLIGGLVADDWTTAQMVRQGFSPAGYHCERVKAIEFRQVP